MFFGREDIIDQLNAPHGVHCGDKAEADGYFGEPTDRFDPRKGHSVSFTIKPGRKLKHLLATFTPVNDISTSSRPTRKLSMN